MNEQFFGAIAAALQMPAAEFIGALKDGENYLPESEIPGKVQEIISGRLKAAKVAQEKRGRREALTEVEQMIYNEGFKPEDNTIIGPKLLAAYIEHKNSASSTIAANPQALSKEDLAKLPHVQALVTEAKQAAAAKLQQISDEYNNFKRTAESREIKSRLTAIAPNVLKEAGIAFEAEGVDTAARLNALFSLLPVDAMKLSESGDIVLMKDNAPLTDDFGKPVTVGQKIIEAAKPLFGERKQNPAFSGSGISGGTAAPATGGSSVMKFASQQAFDNFILSESDQAKRTEAIAAYKQQIQQQAAG